MVCADSPEMDEESVSGSASLTRSLPQSFRRIAGVVQGKRGVLHEKQRKSGHADIRHGIPAVGPASLILHPRARLAKMLYAFK